MHLRTISAVSCWLCWVPLRYRKIELLHHSGYSVVNGSLTVHEKSFCKCPLHCKTYTAPKLLMQPAGVTGSWKVTDLKGEIVCGLLQASYFNIMQQWQLSVFNHEARDFRLGTWISHNLGIWGDTILHSPSQLLRVPARLMLEACL